MYVFELWFSLAVCPGVKLLDHIVVLFLFFFREPQYYSPQRLYYVCRFF